MTTSAVFPRQLASDRFGFREWWTVPTMLSFTAGLLTDLRFQFGGRVSVGELLLAMIAVFAVMANLGNPRFWHRRVCVVLLLLSISFAGYIVSDLVNATPTDRLIRGWARLAFVIIDFVAVWALTRNSLVNLFAICVGNAFSYLLTYGQEHANFFYDYKFHLSQPFSILVMFIVPMAFPRRPGFSTGVALGALGCVHLLFDTRIVGAVCIMIGFVLVARGMSSSRFRSLSLALLALAVILGVFSTAVFYQYGDQDFANRREGSNHFRYAAAQAGISAIERSPIFGSGSWFWDSEMWNVLSSHLSRADLASTSTDDLNAHSQILQAAAEAGVLGAVFFIYYAGLLYRVSFVLVFKRRVDLITPLFMYYLFIAIWDLLFSPFANLHRFAIGLTLAISIHVLRKYRPGRS